jgi:hypothetical protein
LKFELPSQFKKNNLPKTSYETLKLISTFYMQKLSTAAAVAAAEKVT